jgi:hypothetical protein
MHIDVVVEPAQPQRSVDEGHRPDYCRWPRVERMVRFN